MASDSDLEDFRPAKKKKKLTGTRFKSPLSKDEMSSVVKGYVPSNTQKNTAWAMRVFLEWKALRNQVETDKCPDGLLETPNPAQICTWMCRFVTEVRKQNGEPYPPRTIHQILAGLQRYMLDKSPSAEKFLDTNAVVYRDLHRTCDSVYRQLRSQGIGAAVKHSEPFTPDEEEKLWSSGVLCIQSPKALQRAVFFYVGKHFCIHGGEEQRKLGPSQFVRSSNPDSYTYVEHGSKNRSGRLGQLQLENKRVRCVAVPEKIPVCLVFLLDLYLKKLPQFALEEDILYCRPKTIRPTDDSVPWYEAAAVGKNKLSSMVSEICDAGGIARRTNHSLRATGATSLFQSNVPEKIIQKTIGHRSLKALHMYEHTSDVQQEAVSRVMSTKKTTFEDEMKENICGSSSGNMLQPCVSQSKSTSVTNSTVTNSARCLEHVFGNLTSCNISTITINVGPQICVQSVEDEFDSLAKLVNM